VYDGTKLDYKGEMVTADNFYAVLKGDSETTGRRTLQSNSKSKVFVYFTDHGAPGLVQMPAGGRPIFADELQEVIDYMEAHQMYDEMVFYIEACESGSMFPKLRDD
jgi:legumain